MANARARRNTKERGREGKVGGNGMERKGMERNGMEWNGKERKINVNERKGKVCALRE